MRKGVRPRCATLLCELGLLPCRPRWLAPRDFYAWADFTWGATRGLKRDGLLEVGLSSESKDAGGTIDGTAVFTWHADVIEVGWRSVAAGDPAIAGAKADIVRVLEEHGGELPSKAELRRKVTRHRETLERAVNELISGGRLIEVAGGRGRSTRLRLNAMSSATSPDNAHEPGRTTSPTSPGPRPPRPRDREAPLKGASHSERPATSPVERGEASVRACEAVFARRGRPAICPSCGGGMPAHREICSMCEHVTRELGRG